MAIEPRWETNDDVAMAMVAHGFGIAAHPSPHIVFSNSIWGFVAQALHRLTPLPGYTLGI